MVRACASVLLAVLVAVLVAGCGGGASTSTSTSTVPRGARTPTRAADRPALPPGWHRAINRAGGFSFGLPPGWRARRAGTLTRVRSADRGLALSVSADRGGGVAADPRAYARATLGALRAYAHLRRGRAQRLIDAPYAGASATARGRLRETGVDQRIVAIALRPPDLGVTYSLLAFSSAAKPASRYAPALEQLIGTFRVECC